MISTCVLLIGVGWKFGWIWLCAIGIFSIGVLIYGGFIEPLLVRTTFYQVGATDKPDTKPVRLVFLSDFHVGLKKRRAFYQRIADKVQALKPDLIILGGDIVDESAKDIGPFEPITRLEVPLGIHFILGNHDFFDDPAFVTNWLVERGCKDLTNRVLTPSLNDGGSFELIGLDDSWFGSPDMGLVQKPKQGTRIIVTHEPDLLVDLPEGCADLVLLGHTHGGQIRLPFYGPVTGLPQSAPQWLDSGEKYWRNLRIIISRGIAEAGVRARLGSPPEIVVLDIK